MSIYSEAQIGRSQRVDGVLAHCHADGSDEGSGYTSSHLASKRISVMLAKVILQPVAEGA